MVARSRGQTIELSPELADFKPKRPVNY